MSTLQILAAEVRVENVGKNFRTIDLNVKFSPAKLMKK